MQADAHRRVTIQGIRFATSLVLLALVLVFPSSALADLAASRDDAFVTHDAATDQWSIGNRSVQLSLGVDRTGALLVQRLVNLSSGDAWDISPGADVSLMAGDEPLLLATKGALAFAGAFAMPTAAGVQLEFSFEHRGLRLRIVRGYAVYRTAPVIETWTRIESLPGGEPVDLSRLVGWQITMPAPPVKSLAGLRSYALPGEIGSFDMVETQIEPDGIWEIGSDRRSTEDHLPFISIDDGQNIFFGGIMWSGAWRITCERREDRLRVTAKFPETPTVSASRTIEIPHAFFGVTTHGPGAEPSAVRQFIVNGFRGGRPFEPLVTYNTWFAYGTLITEGLLRTEIDRAAAIGAEVFVVDAGWYTNSERSSPVDFEAGLGRFTADPDRFPSALSDLVEHAHHAGMKFGLWVEPERVALDLLAEIGVQESWLATRDGQYGFEKSGQICLAGAAGRQWLVDRLIALIDAVNPDYLKWDNNGWLNCDREGHGHGADDGNFAHVDGLYQVLREIRRRFPDLIIENCSGGGNRLDFGMLTLTDVGWMDDRTSPASHVRHNLEGLTSVLPAPYLLSFFVAEENEEIGGNLDLGNIVRSRMPGVLGLTFRFSELSPEAGDTIATEIQRYKAYRNILTQANATLLSRQAPVFDGWDVLQEVTDDGLYGVIFAFKGPLSDDHIRVNPRGLVPDSIYDVYSADVGFLGTAAGESLMADGIEIVHALGGSDAHLLVLTGTPSDQRLRR